MPTSSSGTASPPFLALSLSVPLGFGCALDFAPTLVGPAGTLNEEDIAVVDSSTAFIILSSATVLMIWTCFLLPSAAAGCGSCCRGCDSCFRKTPWAPRGSLYGPPVRRDN